MRRLHPILIRPAVLLLLSMLVPAFGLSLRLLRTGSETGQLLEFWQTLPALFFLTFFLSGLGVPLVLSTLLLKDRPERVMLTPAAFSLMLLLPLELFCDDMLFPLFVCLTSLSFLFLLTPCLRPCKRFGEFERIPPELALKGFCLLEASGTTLVLIPILLRVRNWRLLADQGLFLLFLAILYFGALWLRRKFR